MLEVRKGNTAAVNLYQKQGFSISAVRRGFYSDGEDAYFMELSLADGERIRI
jgi:ribosomal-protein-alanine N-acetyltransferase